jgi:hypothetical protein
MDKTLLLDEQNFDRVKSQYWVKTKYQDFYVPKPESYPCVALEHTVPSGDLGRYSEIYYVYLGDFTP